MWARGVILATFVAGLGGSTHAAQLPHDAAVLPGRMVSAILHQCSRNAPTAGESTWQPGADDVLTLERALPTALVAQAAKGDPDWSKAPTGWRRQYVGIVLNGRRLIYGNFFPRQIEASSWRAYPQIVCDGGPNFFGVVYDADARRIIDLAFNGSI
jgi:hypothetical protein